MFRRESLENREIQGAKRVHCDEEYEEEDHKEHDAHCVAGDVHCEGVAGTILLLLRLLVFELKNLLHCF